MSKFSVLLVAFTIAMPAIASTTKVGNGDDGADLEALTPITGGPILIARDEALLRLQRLNVAGIAGMGMVIPELQRSEMLMAAQDVRATSEAEGAMEVSDDRVAVYARTFAEPNAATRFFPASLKLTPEQLIALHIHEALHRALPADVREDENKVSHITMALTSPGASHDRVRQVAAIYMKPAPLTMTEYQNLISSSRMVSPVQKRQLLPRTPAKLTYKFSMFETVGEEADDWAWHGLEFVSSLGGYRNFLNLDVEPQFRARMMNRSTDAGAPYALGLTAYDLSGRIRHEDGSITAPFIRFSAKSLEDYYTSMRDRDIWTVGLSHQRQNRRSYLESNIFYSFASETRPADTVSVKYNPILSLAVNGGWAWGRWRMGGVGEVHSSEGRTLKMNGMYFGDDNSGEWRTGEYKFGAFRLLAVGPEFGFAGSSFQFKIQYKTLLTSTYRNNFSSLGDPIDRGLGNSGLSLTLAAIF